MIAYNICHTTLLRGTEGVDETTYEKFEIEQEEPLIVKPPRQDQFDYGDWDYEEEDSLEDRQTKVTRKYEISFVKSEVRKGLLPTMSEKLLDARKRTKKLMKLEKKKIDVFNSEIFPCMEKSFEELSENSKTLLKKAVPDIENTDKISSFQKEIKEFFFNTTVSHSIFDNRQLSLKVSCNSNYGFLGAQVSGKYSLVFC